MTAHLIACIQYWQNGSQRGSLFLKIIHSVIGFSEPLNINVFSSEMTLSSSYTSLCICLTTVPVPRSLMAENEIPTALLCHLLEHPGILPFLLELKFRCRLRKRETLQRSEQCLDMNFFTIHFLVLLKVLWRKHQLFIVHKQSRMSDACHNSCTVSSLFPSVFGVFSMWCTQYDFKSVITHTVPLLASLMVFPVACRLFLCSQINTHNQDMHQPLSKIKRILKSILFFYGMKYSTNYRRSALYSRPKYVTSISQVAKNDTVFQGLWTFAQQMNKGLRFLLALAFPLVNRGAVCFEGLQLGAELTFFLGNVCQSWRFQQKPGSSALKSCLELHLPSLMILLFQQ